MRQVRIEQVTFLRAASMNEILTVDKVAALRLCTNDNVEAHHMCGSAFSRA